MDNEELEWELHDIFESGLFAFPIYEHNGARRIVQYLIYRGVPDEEIADAIEDSTQDLWIWLHRGGKNMVGEWVIMWINEVRDDWRQMKKRERKERRERRRLVALGEISPNRETTTTYGSGTGSRSGSRRDLSSSLRSLTHHRGGGGGTGSESGGGGSSTAGGPWSTSRKKKKLPEPTAPEERLLHERGRRASSARYSSKKPSTRSLFKRDSKSKSKSDTALQDIEKHFEKKAKKKSNWDQSTLADIRHIDSSSSTLNGEQDASIGDILTNKSSVTVIIEHVNDNEQPPMDLKDETDAESQTAKDNLNNNIEDTNGEEVGVVGMTKQQSDSEKESDTEHMDTKVTDSESDAEIREVNKNLEGKVEEQEFVIIKRRKRQDNDEASDQVVVIEKTFDDTGEEEGATASSDVMSENLSDYNEPHDLSSGSVDAHTQDQCSPEDPAIRLQPHHQVHMELVLEGYYKSVTQDQQQGPSDPEDMEEDAHSENVHDSGINTPDMTADIDPLSPTEKDFFFNKDAEFDDTFSEIFYDAEIDFETSSRVGSADGGLQMHQNLSLSPGPTRTILRRQRDIPPDQTTFTMITQEEEFTRSEELAQEISANIESDRKLVAAILDQKPYAERIEVVDIPEDLRLPHERFLTETTKETVGDRYSSTRSICSECSLTRAPWQDSPAQKRKLVPGSPKRRSRDCLDIGLPVCYECKCTIAHYSYSSQVKPIDHLGYTLSNYCDVVFSDSALKAMEFNIDTLDKGGPGFIFVLAETHPLGSEHTLPWTTEQRYKIASSRHPDRWVMELKSRNIELDVVWQIRVQNHVQAVREVHTCLETYNLHSDWFRCSLAVIIENVLNIASKYRVAVNTTKH